MGMDLGLREQQDVLKRLLALFLSLADLCERAVDRSSSKRAIMIWLMQQAETIAHDYIIEPTELIDEGSDSADDLLRLAASFRAAALSIAVYLQMLGRLDRRSNARSRQIDAVGWRGGPCRAAVLVCDYAYDAVLPQSVNVTAIRAHVPFDTS